MAVKTAYKKPKAEAPAEEIPEPNIPKVEIDGEPPESMAGISAELPEEVRPTDAVMAAVEAAAEADQSKYALLKQIEAMRRGAEVQRQAAMQAYPQRPPTREEKLAYWRANGLPDAELTFLEANPELIDMPDLTASAANEAAEQGHERGTEAHMNATKEIFDKHLAHLRARAEAAQPTPEFFKPPPPPEPPSPASYTSAPVSHGAVGAGYQPSSPSQVRLSADEIAIARASGISPVEYARNKQRLVREKASGQRQ